MDRRDFLVCSGTCVGAGVAGLALASTALAAPAADPQAAAAQKVPPQAAAAAQAPQAVRPRYAFEIDMVEAEGKCPYHQPGQKILYPAEAGKVCPWLMDSMSGAIRVLEWGGTLPWLYKGTPYEKVIDPEGLTTEFIRCPDPTRAVVAKISRRRV